MSDPAVAAVAETPTLPAARRMELIAAPRFLDPEATNLVRMLIETRHVDEVAGILDVFEQLVDEAAGRVQATVTTAGEPSADDRQGLGRASSGRVGEEVRVTAAGGRPLI